MLQKQEEIKEHLRSQFVDHYQKISQKPSVIVHCIVSNSVAEGSSLVPGTSVEKLASKHTSILSVAGMIVIQKSVKRRPPMEGVKPMCGLKIPSVVTLLPGSSSS